MMITVNGNSVDWRDRMTVTDALIGNDGQKVVQRLELKEKI